MYIYYWPRGADNIPADVTVGPSHIADDSPALTSPQDPATTTTNVANWGQPSANLSIPNCRSDFNNHVIVFDTTFCGA